MFRLFTELCSDWPEGLETDADCERHFPLETVESDYTFVGSSLRHPQSREVTVKVSARSFILSPLDRMLKGMSDPVAS